MLDPGAQLPDLRHTQHDGQLLALPRSNEVEDGPRALARHLIEAGAPLEVTPEGALGDVLLMQQAQAVLPPLRFPELVGRALVVWCPLLDRCDRALWGLGGKPAQLSVFAHATSSWGHGHPPVRGRHDPSHTVDTNRKIDGRSASGTSVWKAARWWDPSEAYRAAVSFNS